jgi:methionyl-tRNA formyltransferase
MNIVFFGSSEFAVPALTALAQSHHKILCVVTQPDREKGRHLRLEATAVKEAALGLSLPLYQSDSANSAQSLNFLVSRGADIFVVVSYGQILSAQVLAIPKRLCLNAHASLLPKYRGAAPINWALIRGEKESGVSIIKMVTQMDAGPLILQKAVAITEAETAITLQHKLAALAASLILQALELIEKQDFKLAAQQERLASLAPKLKKEDGLIDWGKPAAQIHNLIRGTLPWPGAFTYYKGRILKIYKAEATNQKSEVTSKPGEIIEVSKKEITVATGDGNLAIGELQIEGKRRITAEEFIAGHKIRPGEILAKN